MSEDTNPPRQKTPDTEPSPLPLGAAACSPSLRAYAAFHAARLAALEDFVAKEKEIMVKCGFNDSGPVEWECRWRGLAAFPEFTEREVWQVAWEACEANRPSSAAGWGEETQR